MERKLDRFRFLFFLIACCFTVFFPVSNSQAETIVPAGPIAGTWTADESPYIVQGDITLGSGETLSVEPGATVRFDAGVGLSISGTLTAEGTADNPIIFTSSAAAPQPGDWTGLNFYYGSSNSLLSDCRITYAVNAVYVYAVSNGCDGESAKPTIRGCELAYNSAHGVYTRGRGHEISGCTLPKTGAASPVIDDCDIHHNGSDGIYANPDNGYHTKGSCSSPITGNRIHDNGGRGIRISGSGYASPTIEDNVITDNAGDGIYCTSSLGRAEIAYNDIARNSGNGIYNRHEFMTIEANRISGNGQCGVDTEELDLLFANDIAGNAACGLNYAGAAELTAEDHYWGTDAPATVITGGPVDFDPFRTAPDTVPPEVASVYPADGASDAALGVIVQIAFSEAIDTASITEDSVTVTANGDAVAGTVSHHRENVWFTPNDPLAPDTEYTVAVAAGIRDGHFQRNPMAAPYTFSFTTIGECGDYCPGRVVASLTGPIKYSKGLAHDGQDLWFRNGRFLYRVLGAGVAGNGIDIGFYSPSGLTFDGDAFWCDNPDNRTLLRVDPSGAVLTTLDALGADTTGLAFDGTHLLSASSADRAVYRMDTAGNVLETIPLLHGPKDLAFDGIHIWYARDRRVYGLDDDGKVFTSYAFDADVNGLAFDGRFLWVHEGGLAPGTMHQLAILSDEDAQPPAVGRVSPTDGATDVDAGAALIAVFSESIDARTLDGASFTLHDGADAVPGTVSLHDRTAWFIPDGFLAYDAAYTATLTTAIRDQAGNPLTEEFSWTFTTAPDCGNECPGRVLAAIPAHHDKPPKDIAFDDDSVWVAVQDDIAFRQVAISGDLISSLNANDIYNSFIEALAHDGVDFWIADATLKKIYRVDLAGDTRDTFDLPEAITWPRGVAAAGDRVWINADGFAYRMDRTGRFDMALPAPAVRRIAFDGTYLWFLDAGAGKIHRMDASGDLLGSIPTPSDHPGGLTFDGTHLWCLDSFEKQIYRIAVSQGQPALTVSPDDEMTASGTVGGPFTPTSQSYDLINTGQETVDWEVSGEAAWLAVSPKNGTLAPGGDASITVALTAEADALTAGGYPCLLVFRDSSGGTASRKISLVVSPHPSPPFTTDGFSSDPSPAWAWESNGGVGTFRYKLDDNDLTNDAVETEETTFTPPAPLDDGVHTLYVQEQDANGGWSDAGAFSIEIDTAPPCSWVMDAPARTCPARESITIRYYNNDRYDGESSCTADTGGSGVETVALYVQAPGADAFTSPAGYTDAGDAIDGEFTYAIDGEGTYRFYTLAADRAGNAESPPSSHDAETEVGPAIMGDLNDDLRVDLADAVAGLRILAGDVGSDVIRPDFATCGPDLDGDGRVGLAEVIFILRDVSDR